MAPLIRRDLKDLAERAAATGAPGIDRVVIFIDDLDRCAAKDVVRVLEAVNLLFGFELFVVVIAVDSRWLTRSLRDQFKAAFDDQDTGAAPTPRDYLEKIIQIPFWLRPMARTGYENLIGELVGATDDSTSGSTQQSALDRVRRPASASRAGRTEEASTKALPDDASSASTAPTAATAPPVRDPKPDLTDLNPDALRITREELSFIRQLAPLVETPRAAKRLLNTYRLLRASMDDLNSLLDDNRYEAVLILLALMTGTAGIDDAMAKSLHSSGSMSLDGLFARPAWKEIKKSSAKLPTDRVTAEVLAEWLPRVARYSFHPTTFGAE